MACEKVGKPLNAELVQVRKEKAALDQKVHVLDLNAKESKLALLQLQATLNQPKGKPFSPTILSSPVGKLQVPKKREIKDQEKEMLRQKVMHLSLLHAEAQGNADKIAVAYEQLEVQKEQVEEQNQRRGHAIQQLKMQQ